MAAKPKVKSFKSLLASRKNKKTQVVLPSIGVATVKITTVGDDIVQLDGKVGGQPHTFFMHYSAVVLAT